MQSLPHIELLRRGVGLVPAPGSGQEGSAIHVELAEKGRRPLRSCTCKVAKRRTCDHLAELARALRRLEDELGGRAWDAVLAASVWYRLARSLAGDAPAPATAYRVSEVSHGDATALRFADRGDRTVLLFLADGAERTRFRERTGVVAEGELASDRAGLLRRLALFQAGETERRMNEMGVRTRGQAWEESLLYRLAYHCVREHGDAGTFAPAVDRASGDMTVVYRAGERDVARLVLPRLLVRSALRLLAAAHPDQADLQIQPIPLRAILRVDRETEVDVAVRSGILAVQRSGEETFVSREEAEKYRYGDLVYLVELGVLAELEKAGAERTFKAPRRLRLERGQVASFLDEHRSALEVEAVELREAGRRLHVFRELVGVTATRHRRAGDAHRVGLSYRFRDGDAEETAELADLVAARAAGAPFLETAGGWIDLRSPDLAVLDRLVAARREDGELRLSTGELLRLQAESKGPIEVTAAAGRQALLGRLLALRPAAPWQGGLASELRDYQRSGVDWLRFLAENRLGGLLCDEMGLGKTHQAMALLVSLAGGAEAGDDAAPALVVCPTTVLSHWRRKLAEHAPGLAVTVHHGPERDLAAARRGDVVVTSYGVLRRDAEALAETGWAALVCDEIQHLKNPDTASWQAAARLRATVRLGLTGTPIENRAGELGALLDVVLPGYLGDRDERVRRFGLAGEPSAAQARELRRVVAPFVLRRTKRTVLRELPEKIEDLRTCELSPDQAELYRRAVEGRGAELVARVRASGEAVPYLHVFALLDHLKQVCDHPALALSELDEAPRLASGKWDLYRELLDECLDADLKVVVFSQYLGMIELMRRDLLARGVGHVVLTGQSRDRGALLERFAEDATCRVFLGSLRAGGVGIDLVAASVVIHYDRWWNAAREDQATDRVHRIGQTRGVQVFKLVTEGTLEERIATMIERKRQLLDEVVEEDDPRLGKSFSREEILELLKPAG